MDEQRGVARQHTRRAILRGMVGAAGAALLAACGGASATPTAPPPAATGTSGAAGATVGATATAARPAGTVGTGGATATRAGTAGATPTGGAVAGSPAAGAGGGQVIRSTIPGVPDLHLAQIPPFKSATATPGRGGKVTSFHITYGNAPLVPRAENTYWQELEKRFGATLEPIIAPAGSYQEKLAAITASGDIPDLTLLVLASAPEQNKVIQQGAYTDLTPYLGGEARKTYPNLALLSDRYWQSATIKGKIYGVPRPTTLVGNTLVFRQDWADKFNVARPKNAEEFFQLLQSMTKNDPDGNGQQDTYGLGANGGTWDMQFFHNVFRTPNNWRKNADGTLTAAIETDEYRAAVTFAQRLFAAGTFHPDAATMNTTQAKEAFGAGKIGAYTDGTGGVSDFRPRGRFALPATANAIGLVPFGHDGGKAVTYNGSGLIGFVGIPARVGRDAERVKELLRICDYYCAPFGSEEKVFLDQGIQGVHHTVNAEGLRVTNDRLGRERGDLANLCKAAPVVSNFLLPDEARRTFEMYEGLQAIAIDDPTQTAFSQTYVSKVAELAQLEKDRISAIIQGREPLSALDGLIRDWRSRGGEQIRKEFEADLKG